ncbi:HEAT repeat domain-containing protein [Pelagicoccus mobilis]
MQHSARDPLRDHAHGRIYRITHKTRPLVEPFEIAGSSIEQLIAGLNSPEDRTRYRIRNKLRGRSKEDVLAALSEWTKNLDTESANYEKLLLEALWINWGFESLDLDLLKKLLRAKSHQVRAAAVRALRYNSESIPNYVSLLLEAANDSHPRVRLETIIAASRIDENSSQAIVEQAARSELDPWMRRAYEQALVNLGGKPTYAEAKGDAAPGHLDDKDKELWTKGAEIYRRDGYCITCHQADGKGLPAAHFPPLAGTDWVTGNPGRLIDVTLHGLLGPITVNEKRYQGHVPMTPFKDLLDDEELAAVLTYIRNAFGNQAAPISIDQVQAVRASSANKSGFWTEEELNKKYQAN